MPSNKSLIAKADLVLGDLARDGGLLQPEQNKQFVKKLIVQPTIMNSVRTVGLSTPTRKINKIGFGSRILRKATAVGTALESARHAKPQTEQVEINCHEIMAQVNLPYDVIEDNIERASAANNEPSNTGPGGLRTTVLNLIAARAATDLEEFGLHSDTESSDEDLTTQDGFMKLALEDGNSIDHQNQAISKDLFKAGKKLMPKQYLRETGKMIHYISTDQETEYRDILSDRGTALGDAMLTGKNPIYAFGGRVRPVTQLFDDQGLYLDPMNLIYGIYRDISMEYDKNIFTRMYNIVLTMRIGFQIEEAEAVVRYTNIKA